VAQNFEVIEKVDQARCTWVEGTRSEFICDVEVGKYDPRAAEVRIVRPLDMTETIANRACRPLAQEGKYGQTAGNACPKFGTRFGG
jgi:hypothetical protein